MQFLSYNSENIANTTNIVTIFNEM